MGIWDEFDENTQSIHLMGTNLTSLEGMPQNLPYLELLDLRNNQLENFIGLPPSLPNIRKIHLDNNPLRSLHGVSLSLLPDILKAIIRSQNGITAFYFSESASSKISNVISFQDVNFNISIYDMAGINDLYEYFKESPLEIAQKFIKSSSLTPDETERLLHESSYRERDFLEKYLPLDHHILREINRNLSLKIKYTYHLLK